MNTMNTIPYVAAAASAAHAAAVHKHKQHKEDPAKSCTTYQNLVFDANGSHTEPIIVCDTDYPPLCPEPEIPVECTIGIVLGMIVAAVSGIAFGRWLGGWNK